MTHRLFYQEQRERLSFKCKGGDRNARKIAYTNHRDDQEASQRAYLSGQGA